MAELNFDANTVDIEPASYDVIPPGWYQAQIVASELKPTSKGNGMFLLLEFDVLDGVAQGRKIWDRLNLQNPNQQAVDIAQRTLARICQSIGVAGVGDSEELHFKPMSIKVATAKERLRDDGTPFDPKSEIKGYRSITSAVSAPNVAQQATAPAAQAAPPASPPPAQKRPPWEQSKAV